MATDLGWPLPPEPPRAPVSGEAPTGGVYEKVGDGDWCPLEGDHQHPGKPIPAADLPWLGWWPA